MGNFRVGEWWPLIQSPSSSQIPEPQAPQCWSQLGHTPSPTSGWGLCHALFPGRAGMGPGHVHGRAGVGPGHVLFSPCGAKPHPLFRATWPGCSWIAPHPHLHGQIAPTSLASVPVVGRDCRESSAHLAHQRKKLCIHGLDKMHKESIIIPYLQIRNEAQWPHLHERQVI